MFTNTKKKDVFINIQDSISGIIPQVKFPYEIWGRLILHSPIYSSEMTFQMFINEDDYSPYCVHVRKKLWTMTIPSKKNKSYLKHF